MQEICSDAENKINTFNENNARTNQDREDQSLSEMVSTHPEFPSAFAALYHSGEISGTLDDALRRSHVLFQEEGSRKMKQFVFAAAGALVAAVMLMAAWNIIKFYLGYFQQINDAINMNAK